MATFLSLSYKSLFSWLLTILVYLITTNSVHIYCKWNENSNYNEISIKINRNAFTDLNVRGGDCSEFVGTILSAEKCWSLFQVHC